jgi:pyrroline-5-carboxylate reductase
MKTKSLGFIGGGRITRIFLQAFVNKKVIFSSISVFDTDLKTLDTLKLHFPFIQVAKSVQECAEKDIVFLALHPTVIMETLQQIKEVVTEQTILISLAPKITIGQMASFVKCLQIARVLPNATSIINQAYNPVTFKTTMSDIHKWSILEMLNTLGHAFETSEEKMEGYAIISSLLPTYFWFQWHEVETIGNQFGLSLAECRESIYETMNAALNIMYRSGINPQDVMDLISSKPLSENEEQIKAIYKEKLNEIYHKIKPLK